MLASSMRVISFHCSIAALQALRYENDSAGLSHGFSLTSGAGPRVCWHGPSGCRTSSCATSGSSPLSLETLSKLDIRIAATEEPLLPSFSTLECELFFLLELPNLNLLDISCFFVIGQGLNEVPQLLESALTASCRGLLCSVSAGLRAQLVEQHSSAVVPELSL